MALLAFAYQSFFIAPASLYSPWVGLLLSSLELLLHNIDLVLRRLCLIGS